MTAIVEISGARAVIRDYQWHSTDKTLETVLNTMLDPLGPSGSDPNPDETAALDAVKRLGGKLVSADETESEGGVVY